MLMERLLGRRVSMDLDRSRIRKSDKQCQVANIARLVELLGERPRCTWEQGLGRSQEEEGLL